MTIQELLKLAFEAGTSFGRKPFSHVNRDAVDFDTWMKENQFEIDSSVSDIRDESFQSGIDAANNPY